MQTTDDYSDMPLNDRPSPAPTAPRRRSFIAPIAAMVLVITLAAVFVLHTQQHATTKPLVGAAITTLPANSAITATSLVGGDDIWGVGSTLSNPADVNTAATGFIARYTGGQWHMVDNTDFANTALTAITMLSDTEGWAVGRVATGQPHSATSQMQNVVYHYTAGHWSKADITIPVNHNAYIQPIGHDDAWLLTANGSDSTVFHYSKGAWRTIAAPATFDYFTMLSDNEGWFNQQQTLWHYQAGQWQLSYSVASEGASKSIAISSGSFAAPNDGWGLVYDDPNNTRPEGLPVLAVKTTIIHYDGTQWTPVTAPSQLLPLPQYHFAGFWMRTTQDGWGLIDAMPDGTATIDENTVARYLGHYINGTWSLVTTPAQIMFVAIKMTSATDGWAVGERYDAQGIYSEAPLPVILHYQAGAWNVAG